VNTLTGGKDNPWYLDMLDAVEDEIFELRHHLSCILETAIDQKQGRRDSHEAIDRIIDLAQQGLELTRDK
jgi:hypothetical protein